MALHEDGMSTNDIIVSRKVGGDDENNKDEEDTKQTALFIIRDDFIKEKVGIVVLAPYSTFKVMDDKKVLFRGRGLRCQNMWNSCGRCTGVIVILVLGLSHIILLFSTTIKGLRNVKIVINDENMNIKDVDEGHS